jgi:hypothetical protein
MCNKNQKVYLNLGSFRSEMSCGMRGFAAENAQLLAHWTPQCVCGKYKYHNIMILHSITKYHYKIIIIRERCIFLKTK